MRKIFRNRLDSPPRIIKNYKFAVYLEETPPAEFWEQARSMNSLWNNLLDVRDALKVELKELLLSEAANALETNEDINPDPSPEQGIGRRKRIQSEEEKTLWIEFDRKLREISVSPDWKAKLNNNAREYVLDKFRTASIAAFKNKGDLRRKSDYLTGIFIPHRFTGGGWEVERIFESTAKKIHIDPLPQDAFDSNRWQARRARLTTGFYGYGIDNRPLRLKILLHRPLPARGLIKTTGLVGKFDQLRRVWSWHLLVACQSEPLAEAKLFKPAAAVDFGYRRMDEYLRIGFILDTAGNRYELRLPIIEPPSRRLLNALRSVNDWREKKNLVLLKPAEFFPLSIFDIREWQHKTDLMLERAKESIRETIEQPGSKEEEINFPDEINDLLKRLKLVRRSGLRKLWKLTAGQEAAHLQKIHELLDAWKRKDLENLTKIKTTGTRLINKRNKAYENIALWLKQNFSYLIFNQNFSPEKIAQANTGEALSGKNAPLKAGAKYRFFAAHFFLKRKITEQQNSNRWLIKSSSNRPGIICSVCGELCEPTQKLKIVCPNEHETDQDWQACQNLLRELPDDLIYDRSRTIEAKIPTLLDNFIVRV